MTAPADHRPPPIAMGPQLGERLGLSLARRIGEGRDELTVRMDPAELGRVQVRLSFDDGGNLRAVVSADSPMVLDTLRRDAPDLARTLSDQGVRTDAQTFRFDRGHHGNEQQQPRPEPAWTRLHGDEDPTTAHERTSVQQPIRHRGRLNLMA